MEVAPLPLQQEGAPALLASADADAPAAREAAAEGARMEEEQAPHEQHAEQQQQAEEAPPPPQEPQSMEQDDQQQQQQPEQEALQSPQQPGPAATPTLQPTGAGLQQLQMYFNMVITAQHIRPGICTRGEPAPQVAAPVADWATVKKNRGTATGGKSQAQQHREREAHKARWQQQRAGVPKIAGTAGRTFTSRFRGVHQTFPTKRWEAQFRRNGKPTSLGCFDHENEAARAYDRMMLWCEMHAAQGASKSSSVVTNFDLATYECDIHWLTNISQEDLIERLRSEGRAQASQRQSGSVARSRSARGDRDKGDKGARGKDREGTAGRSTHSNAGGASEADDAGDATDAGGGGGSNAALDAAAGAAAAAAAPDQPQEPQQQEEEQQQEQQQQEEEQQEQQQQGMIGLDLGLLDAEQQQQQLSLSNLLSATTPGGNASLNPADPAATAAFLTSPAGAAAAAAVASPAGLNMLFGQLDPRTLQAFHQLQQQLESGEQPDEHAAAAAAFQIGQLAGSSFMAALASQPSPAAGDDGLQGAGGAFGAAAGDAAGGGLVGQLQAGDDDDAAAAGGQLDVAALAAIAAAQEQGLLLQQGDGGGADGGDAMEE